MASGCMVLSSDTDGPCDIIKDPWGMLVPFKKLDTRASELEKGILKLLTLSKEVLQKRGEAARIVARNYNWADCAKAHAKVLERAKQFTLA